MKAKNIQRVLELLVGESRIRAANTGTMLAEIIVTADEPYARGEGIEKVLSRIHGMSLSCPTDIANAVQAVLVAWPGSASVRCAFENMRGGYQVGIFSGRLAQGFILGVMEAAVWLKENEQLSSVGEACDIARVLGEFLVMISGDPLPAMDKEVLGRVNNASGPFLNATDFESLFLIIGNGCDFGDQTSPYHQLAKQAIAELGKAAFRSLNLNQQIRVLNGQTAY